MENSDNHIDIINYLYGEMSPEEKSDFEEKMTNDNTLREEVETLMNTRNVLGQLPDKEVMEPPVRYPSSPGNRNREQYQWIKPLLSVAAVIVILLITGHFTRFAIRHDDNGLIIGFSQNIPAQFVERSEVEGIVKEALSTQQMVFKKELSQTNDSLQALYTLLTRYDQQPNIKQENAPSKTLNEAELLKQMADWQNVNRTLLQKYIAAINEQQQEYMKDALVQFSDYLQQQRENDLLMIQQNLIDLKDYQDLQKKETNQTLASIMQTVSQQK